MRSLLLLALILPAACSRSGADRRPAAATAQAETCIECHVRRDPDLVADHQAGAHGRIELDCAGCHGSDHDEIFSIRGAVPVSRCAECHAKQVEAFGRSRHGQRLRGGKMDVVLRDAELATGGCTATTGCHSIQQPDPDGGIGRCGGCHPTHAFRRAESREPRICLTCHGGVDHPQYDAWQRSAHSLPARGGTGPIAGCVACHDGHDVGAGITHGLPPSVYETRLDVLPTAPRAEFDAARDVMLARCDPCHGTRFARTALEKADLWRVRGALQLQEASRLVRGLHRDGLLDAPPEERPANPVAGHGMRLGGPQVFDQSTSLPERLYYEMFFQHYPAFWRAAYHTDPERVGWEGNDKLKSALDRLRALDREARGAGASGAGVQR